MSTRVSSNKKPNTFNDANESLYDPYPGFPASEVYASVPWPEWNDAELNAEVWEEVKGKSASTGSKVSTSIVSATAAALFEDSDPPKLPNEIKEYVSSWKRPHEVFSKSNLSVYDTTGIEFTLSVPSPVADCCFFKYFNEIIPILHYYGLKDGFPVEMETSTFIPTTQGEPWKPWHHIYANSKAGKGQFHKPLYCPFGKYVLRLFYFGCWRMIVVDDRIPCDKYGLSMLPVTQSIGELWPILLVKGLLKIISLTNSIMDFSLVSCLTGWISGHITTANKSLHQIWRRMQLFLPRYELPPDEPEVKKIVTPAKETSQKNSSVGQRQVQETVFEKFCVLMANMEGFAPETNLNGVNVILTMNRDLPLVKANKREGTKPWKRFRWVFWASKKGIWTDELSLPPYRRLQLISFVKQLKELLAPDPLQEATLYSLPANNSFDSQSPREPGSADEESYEPKQWLDFYKFCEYLIDMTILFKPSSFLSNLKITCLQNVMPKKDAITPATAKTVVKSDPQNIYFYSLDLTPTLNQPILLYCDSISGIFICFSLWVCPKVRKSLAGYLDPHQPEILKVGHGTLIVENYDWRNAEQGELIGYSKTICSSSILLSLKPGRHVLRIWLSCDSPYVVHLFSNTDLCLHKGPKIRFQMSAESERVKQYIAKVSDEFIALTLKFGKSDLPSALKNFYASIKPGNDKGLLYLRKLDKFIETFLNCIIMALKNLVSNTDEVKIMLGALRSLFFNPNIQCDLPRGQPASLYGAVAKKAVKKVMVVLQERTLSEILSYPWSSDEIKQIIFIQKVFRGYRVRLLLRYQSPARKEFKPYTERLKKISDVIFSPDKRIAEVGKIIRMIVAVDSTLLNTFKFHSDFPNVIDVEEFTGKLFCSEPFAWIPLARFIIACHSPSEPVPFALHFSCNLEQYVVAGVNNDTNEEIFSLANTISPCYYQPNRRGYTIFIFGWNESNPKTVNWRLEMVKMKYFEAMHLCNTMLNEGCHPYLLPSIEVNEIKNFYVPNQKFRMCRCVIKVPKKSLLTCRLSASFPEVQFVLTISLDDLRYSNPPGSEDTTVKGSVVAKCCSVKGAAFLSSIVLENVQKTELWDEADDEFTQYILEAHILNDSWPLTKQEWGIIEPIRVNGETWKDFTSTTQLKKAGSESRKKLTRMSRRSLQERNIENPFWSLQILSDSTEGHPGETMTVEEDRSYQESIKAMKSSWEEKNPGRRKRGKEMRLKFLQAIHFEHSLKRSNFEEEFDIDAEGDGNQFDVREDFKELLQKMTSFSYLTNDKSEERFSKSPRILPWMPTNELLEKYRRDWKEGTLTSSSESCAIDHGLNSVTDQVEERKEFLTACNYYRFVFLNYLAEEQKKSSELMEQAYMQRLKTIQRIMG